MKILFSPHVIAVPKGLYFVAVVFSFFLLLFFDANLWGYWTDLNQTWTHIYLWLLFEIFGPNSHELRAKTAFWGRLWTLTENVSLTDMISTIGKKFVNLQGLPYIPQKLVNFGLETAENGWRVFAHPPKFLHWETLPALSRYNYNRQQTPGELWNVLCSGTSLQSRTTECRAVSRWALPCM